jgi:hypothetical protein
MLARINIDGGRNQTDTDKAGCVATQSLEGTELMKSCPVAWCDHGASLSESFDLFDSHLEAASVGSMGAHVCQGGKGMSLTWLLVSWMWLSWEGC